MTEEEAKLVAGRLETAVDVLVRTRTLVYKCLEFFLISQLHDETSMDLDPLDIMLDRKHGATVETIQAQELAQSAYDNLRRILPDLQPTKGSLKIPLGTPQQALAVEIHSAIRTHFARIPEVIVSKMKKIGWQDGVIPQLKSDQPDDEDDDQELSDADEDDTGSTKCTFKPGHIKSWWL
ncbi:hypothetical protein BGZ65_013044, partial [Modicella reniformis]